jgi:hypothetical protein
VRDRHSKRTARCSLGVSVNQLVVTGGFGEELDLILRDHVSVTVTKMNVHRLLELVETV